MCGSLRGRRCRKIPAPKGSGFLCDKAVFLFSIIVAQLHPKVNFISCPQDKEQETMMNAPRMFITFDSKEIGSCLQFVEFPR